jgi:oligopeptide transport system ATP-binding protein
VDNLSYELRQGETLGIVGESGSGKSVTNLAVMRLLPTPPARVAQGAIVFKGDNLLGLSERQMRAVRGNRIAMIFQDPMTSLNPFLRVSTQLVEVLRQHQRGVSKAEAARQAVAMLARVGIPDAAKRFRHYPHQFSGGMRQRVMIAMMLLNRPELLIADEPTTALDVTIQAQILDLLRDLQAELGTAITLITHDLGVVAGMADQILVLYAGKTMEAGAAAALFEAPAHPYTRGLLASIPRPTAPARQPLPSIPGRPPELSAQASVGCPFARRCAFATARCDREFPPETRLAPDHRVFCWETEQVQKLPLPGAAEAAASDGSPVPEVAP